MLRVGLTGGIGCGKSTVAAILRELGCPVIEADPLAHRTIEPGRPAHGEIVREFGAEVLDSEGRIDRRKLAEIVFADKKKLAQLNKIVHPDVLNSIERWLAEQERGGAPLAIVEAALLIEAGSHKRLDRLVVVWCHPAQQHERLRARGWTAEQIEQRIAAQMPLEAKRRLADDQIDSSGPLVETRRQVGELAARLLQLAAVKPHPLEKQP